jgi:hypothetical protein
VKQRFQPRPLAGTRPILKIRAILKHLGQVVKGLEPAGRQQETNVSTLKKVDNPFGFGHAWERCDPVGRDPAAGKKLKILPYG